MKLFRYKNFIKESKEDIYTINEDSVDVDGDVNLYGKGLTKLPLKFGKVSGYFDCGDNQLISLEGAPLSVGGDFYCSFNQLKSLQGSPKSVGRHFYCDNNQLKKASL
jgi:hypothetical protein